MSGHWPTLQAAIFIVAFFCAYLGLLLRHAVREQIDTFDFILLTAVAAVPLIFVLFPSEMSSLTRLVGVEFPFLLLFGAILVVAFVLLWRTVRRITVLRNQVTRIAQEHALLQDELAELRRQSARA